MILITLIITAGRKAIRKPLNRYFKLSVRNFNFIA